MSSTYESALLAAREFAGKPIRVVDSLYMTMGQGFLAIAAAEAGLSATLPLIKIGMTERDLSAEHPGRLLRGEARRDRFESGDLFEGEFSGGAVEVRPL